MVPAIPGRYFVRVAPLRLGYYLKSITYGNIDLTTNPFTLDAAGAENDISIVLTKTRPADAPPGVKISGRITGWKADGRTLPLFAVLTPADAFEIADVTPKDDGSFEIDGVPPGQYTLGSSFARSRLFEVGRIDITNLSLSMDEVGIPSAPLPMTGSGRYISGVVETGNDTSPQFEVRFTAVRPGPGFGPPHVVPVSGRDFSLILPEGEYRITVSGLPQDYALKSVSAGPMDLTEPFLVTYRGIADRISGTPITSAAGITIRLNAQSSVK
jgi:hypothetical protein